MTIPAGLEPLAIWDCNDHGSLWYSGGHDRWLERIEWAKANVPRVNDTVRLDFYLLDCPFMVAYRVHRGEDGKIHIEHVLEEPAVELLAELPPEHLLRRDAA